MALSTSLQPWKGFGPIESEVLGPYLKDLKSSTNSMKLMELSEIMRFWKPLKHPLHLPCHDRLLHALVNNNNNNINNSLSTAITVSIKH